MRCKPNRRTGGQFTRGCAPLGWRFGGGIYFDRESMVRVPGWWRGRAVLLGDSAFGGSVGMGTSMAIVGAYVLAGELAAGDHRMAFGNYQRLLADYVGGNQKPMPGGMKAFLPKTGLGIRLGNGLTRVMLAGPWRGMLTRGMQDKANSVTLGNYANDAMLVDGKQSEEDACRDRTFG